MAKTDLPETPAATTEPDTYKGGQVEIGGRAVYTIDGQPVQFLGGCPIDKDPRPKWDEKNRTGYKPLANFPPAAIYKSGVTAVKTSWINLRKETQPVFVIQTPEEFQLWGFVE